MKDYPDVKHMLQITNTCRRRPAEWPKSLLLMQCPFMFCLFDAAFDMFALIGCSFSPALAIGEHQESYTMTATPESTTRIYSSLTKATPGTGKGVTAYQGPCWGH